MKPVTVGRYDADTWANWEGPGNPGDPATHWKGWVETEDWIVWERGDGALFVWANRDKPGGGVNGDPTIILPSA